MQWYERAINFTARLGARGTGGHIGALSVRDAMNEDRKRELISEMRERLASLSRYASEKGLQFLLFENIAVSRGRGHSHAEDQSPATSLAPGRGPAVLCLACRTPL